MISILDRLKYLFTPKEKSIIYYCGNTKVFLFFNKRCKKSCPFYEKNCYYKCTSN